MLSKGRQNRLGVEAKERFCFELFSNVSVAFFFHYFDQICGNRQCKGRSVSFSLQHKKTGSQSIRVGKAWGQEWLAGIAGV